MLKECDVFSDSYGCIVTKSIGYQAPFPLVRLSNGGTTVRPPGGWGLQGACFVSSAVPHGTPRGRLLTLDMCTRAPCVSFLQLLPPVPRPLALDPEVAFVAKVDAAGPTTAVVTRSAAGLWSTSVYVADSDTAATPGRRRRLHFSRAGAASLHGGGLWLAEAAADEPGAQTLHHHAVDAALAGSAAASSLACRGAGQPLDVVALSESTALVLGSAGVALADCRQQRADVLFASTLLNGGVTGDRQLLIFDAACALRAYDLRDVSVPLFEASAASYLRIKAEAGRRASLLVASDMAGVFDVLRLTTVASLQHSGDTVLDAAVLPSAGAGLRVCTSTGSGMVYDWTVA